MNHSWSKPKTVQNKHNKLMLLRKVERTRFRPKMREMFLLYSSRLILWAKFQQVKSKTAHLLKLPETSLKSMETPNLRRSSPKIRMKDKNSPIRWTLRRTRFRVRTKENYLRSTLTHQTSAPQQACLKRWSKVDLMPNSSPTTRNSQKFRSQNGLSVSKIVLSSFKIVW